MPLQYPSGITREHVATRTCAGLFDVSHMGRFRVAGTACEAFLRQVLTNDAAALSPCQAHYTFIANESGAAIDDAYLYRLAADDFLLVVNASNRDQDWQWLNDASIGAGVRLTDQSDLLAMIALQGPRSASMLEPLLDANGMPEPRRNRLRSARFGAHEIIVARTGYTGEAVGFELFGAPAALVDLWQRLVEAGATAAGLGARDSLRLEAGLPLYGHELGVDNEGRPIPIFANRLARYGVRRPGNGAYIGSAALDAQRAEYERLVAGAAVPSHSSCLLPRLIQPIAVFDTQRPLRAGYRLFLGQAPVGYVTSGSSVPIIAAGAASRQQMRPIGLALVRSDLRFDPHVRVALEVRDGRGSLMTAELVETNLPAAARAS